MKGDGEQAVLWGYWVGVLGVLAGLVPCFVPHQGGLPAAPWGGGSGGPGRACSDVDVGTGGPGLAEFII